MPRTAFVTIAGRTNAGKSSLLNAIVGEKIASVSNKPQTTRTRITGIRNIDDVQLVFFDTPGLHKPVNKLSEHMLNTVKESVSDIDAVVFVMAVGYAAFAQLLTINGTASIDSSWDVHFDPETLHHR